MLTAVYSTEGAMFIAFHSQGDCLLCCFTAAFVVSFFLHADVTILEVAVAHVTAPFALRTGLIDLIVQCIACASTLYLSTLLRGLTFCRLALQSGGT